MPNLGKMQNSIYEFIQSYINQRAFPPTVREIGAAVGLKSTSTVHAHLKALAESGLIRLNPSKQRSITLPYATDTSVVKPVPLVGSVAAGEPILAYDNIQDTFPLPASLLHGAEAGEVFLLSVEGESMIEAGILNGDMILIHSGITVGNGDIAVVRVNDDTATVKRIFFEKNIIKLQPENSSMEPIFIAPSNVEIVGKVIGLIRRF
ncbi:MAG: transcriptional repressor LexA [Clostridia bacterium]